jgi:hypothetical protein
MKKVIADAAILDKRLWTWKVILALAMLAAFGLRLVNLTNPPLDFASTRQLFSVLKARRMYYQQFTSASPEQRELAIALGDVGTVEPPLLETIVSQTYLSGENLIGRISSCSGCWVAWRSSCCSASWLRPARDQDPVPPFPAL